jgi:hypothetical protein
MEFFSSRLPESATECWACCSFWRKSSRRGNAERRFSPQDILAAMEKQMRAEREKQFSRFS